MELPCLASPSARITLDVSADNTRLVHSEKVLCKYVRREIRALDETDRTSFFDALGVVYNTSTAVGQAR